MVVSPERSRALLEQPHKIESKQMVSNLFIPINLVKNTCLWDLQIRIPAFGSQLLHKFVCHSMNNVKFRCTTIPL